MDEWAGTGWSEAEEEAREDRCARRILACPRKSCRRHRSCRRGEPMAYTCDGYAAFPDTAAELGRLKAVIYRIMKRAVAEADADPVAAEAARAEWRARAKVRRQEALRRAAEEMGEQRLSAEGRRR